MKEEFSNPPQAIIRTTNPLTGVEILLPPLQPVINWKYVRIYYNPHKRELKITPGKGYAHKLHPLKKNMKLNISKRALSKDKNIKVLQNRKGEIPVTVNKDSVILPVNEILQFKTNEDKWIFLPYTTLDEQYYPHPIIMSKGKGTYLALPYEEPYTNIIKKILHQGILAKISPEGKTIELKLKTYKVNSPSIRDKPGLTRIKVRTLPNGKEYVIIGLNMTHNVRKAIHPPLTEDTLLIIPKIKIEGNKITVPLKLIPVEKWDGGKIE